MYVVYINLLYFLSIFLFTYNKNLLFQKKLSYNIKKIYLDTYDPICRIRNCFVCKL